MWGPYIILACGNVTDSCNLPPAPDISTHLACHLDMHGAICMLGVGTFHLLISVLSVLEVPPQIENF